MKRSTERILTTHVGSLSRPDALVPILTAKDRAQPYDRDAYARLVREAVGEVVRRQTEVGVDVITDGEQGKASFFGYIVERFTGFERQAAPPGQEGSTRAGSREYLDFPITTRGLNGSQRGSAGAETRGSSESTSARGR
jgi:methionine synthase II (cobalamin-independent)